MMFIENSPDWTKCMSNVVLFIFAVIVVFLAIIISPVKLYKYLKNKIKGCDD